MENTVYYLPGRNGKIATGLGEGITERGFNLKGRETPESFKGLEFQGQLDLIASDLKAGFWTEDSKIVAVSYGAYLLMHTLSGLDVYPGSILLLSPVLGAVSNPGTLRYYSPPRPNKLMEMIDANSFPKPNHIEMHVGEKDWQCPPDRVVRCANAVGGVCTVVPGKGHDLGKDYVSPVLQKWLLT